MSDGVTLLGLVVGFGFILIVAARLGDGSRPILAGLFSAHAGRDWPTGVQEGDAPRFAVAHLDGLRPGQLVKIDGSAMRPDDVADEPRAELFDLGGRRLGPPHA